MGLSSGTGLVNAVYNNVPSPGTMWNNGTKNENKDVGTGIWGGKAMIKMLDGNFSSLSLL